MLSAAEKQAEAWYIPREELLRRPEETGLAVDPENPAEIDDAIDVRPNKDGSFRIAVHVADAGLIPKDSALSLTARELGWSYYGESGDPSDTIPMLPLSLSKHKLSLDIDNYGLGSPAVTVRFNFDPHLRRIGDPDIYKSRLVDCESISYGQLSIRHRSRDKQARMIVGLAKLLNEDIDKPSDYSPGSYCKDAIGEYMLAANRIIAEEMRKHLIPWLFRYHQTKIPVSLRDLDITNFRQAERDLLDATGRAQYSPTPQRHEGLNLMPYTHFTSPLRRFPDLVNHQILHAMLTGKAIPYTVEELEQISSELARKTISALGLYALKSVA